MKRITAIVTAASASGALAAAAVSAGMLPASASTSAAPRPAAHSTSHTAARPVTRQIARQAKAAKAKAASPIRILSQYGNGQYVSVVHCQSGHVPPPLHVSKPGTPLNLSGQHPSAAVTRSLGRYKPVYRCSLVIKKKPAAPGKGGGIKPCEHVRPGTHGRCNVTLNTGFGGEAGPVSGHRPRH